MIFFLVLVYLLGRELLCNCSNCLLPLCSSVALTLNPDHVDPQQAVERFQSHACHLGILVLCSHTHRHTVCSGAVGKNDCQWFSLHLKGNCETTVSALESALNIFLFTVRLWIKHLEESLWAPINHSAICLPSFPLGDADRRLIRAVRRSSALSEARRRLNGICFVKMAPKGTDLWLRQLLFVLFCFVPKNTTCDPQKQKQDYDVGGGADLEVWQAVVEENVPAAEE